MARLPTVMFGLASKRPLLRSGWLAVTLASALVGGPFARPGSAEPEATPAHTQAPESAEAAEPRRSAPIGATLAIEAPRADFSSIDSELDDIETMVLEAHFHSARALAKSTLSLLEELDASRALDRRRARVEVLLATAEIALGRATSARTHFAEALRADPSLALDEKTTSPKIVEVFESVQKSVGDSTSRGTESAGLVRAPAESESATP